MRFDCIRSHGTKFSAEAMCPVLKVGRAGYYAWLKRGASPRERSNTALDASIQGVFEASRETYGSPRVF